MEFELHTDASNTTSPFVRLVVFGRINKREGWKYKTKESYYGQIRVLEKAEHAYKYKKCNILVLDLCTISAKYHQGMSSQI
jgi:hypothetical protein